MNSKYFLLVVFFAATNACGDFYWRDYDGRIPWDAVPGGKNADGITYIGQAYIHNYGLVLGTLFPGQMEITVSCYGVMKTDVIIKILCSRETAKFYWSATSSSKYVEDTAGKCPILGGFDQKHPPLGSLHVGRTWWKGESIIGNIAAYSGNHPLLYYPLNDKELSTENYEVLLIYGDYIPSKLVKE